MKRTKLEEAIRQWKQRRMKMNEKIKIDEKKKTDEKMKNMKTILRKMIENNKLMIMKKKAYKDQQVLLKTSKSKSKNKG